MPRAATALAAAGAACVAYGTFIERHWFRLRSEHLPGALRQADATLRILLIADTHHWPPNPRMAAFIDEVAREDYDLVVAAGDLLGAAGAEDATVDLLAPLTDGRPGLVVLGAHDVFSPVPKSPHVYFTDPAARRHGRRHDTPRFRTGLEATGWTVLVNERTSLSTPVGTVAVAGLIDPHLPRVRLPEPVEIRPRVEDAVLRLGLVHAPYRRALDLLVGAGHDVVLAGHTHGGQVRLPPFGALLTNCDLPTDRARGTSRWSDAYLHVSAGLGQSHYAPFRFACRPEVSLLTLTG